MKKLSIIALRAMLILTIGSIWGCGTKGTTIRDVTDLTIESTTPVNGENKVALDQAFIVYFTMPVNPSTVQNSNNFFVKPKDVANAQTVPGTISLEDGNRTAIFYPTNKWGLNTAYVVTLTSKITSSNNKIKLSGQQEYIFTTGSTNIIGQISVPGQPYVTSLNIIRSTPFGDCLAFMVEFNEDLSQWPNASLTLNLLGSFNNGWQPLVVWPIYKNLNRYFYLLIDDSEDSYGCSKNYFKIGQELTVNIFNGFDYDNDMMVPKEEDFWYPYHFL